jgi:acetolactate synthase-1/2/3 large subunit
MVVISGQVHMTKIGTDAFQEADIIGISMPITKANFQVRDVSELAGTLKKAFYLAKSGRPGPVLVDIPVNIQNQDAEFSYPEKNDFAGCKADEKLNSEKVLAAMKLIHAAERPLVIAGGGVIFSDATLLLNRFLNQFKIPVVVTLMGHGVNPDSDKLYYGGIGMHGSLYGNYAVQNSDLLIAFGVRFSDRILCDATKFAPRAKIIQVDIDPAEIDKNQVVDIPLIAKAADVLRAFLKLRHYAADHTDWIAELQRQKQSHSFAYDKTGGLKPQYLIELIDRYFPEDTIVVSDVGQNQMWVSQYYRFRFGRSFISSGGLGTMGFALPAAIGAKIGNPEREVVMVAGDGGFQMNIQELATVKRFNLNIKMVIFDNLHLGMVRQWQEIMCAKRYSGTVMADNPDFVRVAKAMGIDARRLTRRERAAEVVKALAQSKKSMLIHALIDPEENVLPMVPPGKSLNDALIKIVGGV